MEDFQQKLEALYSPLVVQNILSWIAGEGGEDTEAIYHLLETDPKGLEALFNKTLTFGTGGMRSLVGIGPNRMNLFTVRKATQGLAYVLKERNPHPGDEIKVVIGYDTRHNSLDFAHETAKVLAGNHIHALLFKDPQPLAMVSFAVRTESAAGGVMITASHNPPEYNGYKVYMASGGQVLPPMDQEIVHAFQGTRRVLSAESIEDPYIHFIGEEYEVLFRKAVGKLQLFPRDNRISGPSLRILYSPLHGTGLSLVPRVLNDWGFFNVRLIEKQALPDGDFPTVVVPNPEDPRALSMGIEQMLQDKGDLFIATDPDADRLGVVCLDEAAPYVFSGNQIACVLADHILCGRSQFVALNENDKIIKSLVTTDMLTAITRSYGGDVVNVSTGFKYIGEKIEEWKGGKEKFVFGAEESFGYLYGSHVEDKDGISASALIAEAALQKKLQGKTLREAILDLYEIHGYFMNKTISLSFDKNEEETIRMRIEALSQQDPSALSMQNRHVVRFEDYRAGIGRNVLTQSTYLLHLPPTSMLCYYYNDGSSVIVRLSGTEPKIKLYFEIVHRYPIVARNKKEQEQREEESTERLCSFIQSFREKFFIL